MIPAVLNYREKKPIAAKQLLFIERYKQSRSKYWADAQEMIKDASGDPELGGNGLRKSWKTPR